MSIPPTQTWHAMHDDLNLLESPQPSQRCDASPANHAIDLRLSEVVSALSCALDLTEGQPAGHAVRTCLLGMRLARKLGLDDTTRSALYYALMLKDLGCSSNAARLSQLFGADDHVVKKNFKTTDWPRLINAMQYIGRNICPTGNIVQKLGRFIAIGVAGDKGARQMIKTRCERGASIARLFGLTECTAQTIQQLDEHYNGQGHPLGLKGEEISITARIAGLCQTVEVFLSTYGLTAALDMARKRCGRWFDPMLVDLLVKLEHDDAFWQSMTDKHFHAEIGKHEPEDQRVYASDRQLDRVALGFAQVVDAKSPWTRKHSEHVTELAVGIGRVMGFDDALTRWFRRAALLHDVGKLGVSNSILDKPGKLTDAQRQVVMQHPRYTFQILSRVRGFEFLAQTAASHHERLDGKGYHLGLEAKHLSKPVRALVVADIFEAISAQRPYRDTMPMDKVFAIMDDMVGTGICPEAFAALRYHVDTMGYTPSRMTPA